VPGELRMQASDPLSPPALDLQNAKIWMANVAIDIEPTPAQIA
jgi:hypothetical protein